MKYPVQLTRYVSLVVANEISPEDAKKWFACVKTCVGGLVNGIANVDENNLPVITAMVRRKYQDKISYIIPVVRDLTPNEVETITKSFAEKVDFDFEVAASTIEVVSAISKEVAPINIPEDRLERLALEWAKRQHETWVKDREASGWRYGISVSHDNKTHPLMRPWNDLPECHRKVDLQQPQMLLDLLNDQGLFVVTKNELDSIRKLLK